MIHSSKTRKEKGMIIKLDMSNAFDRVKHSFLYRVLEKFGFNTQFIMQIKACIRHLWIAPLINKRPARFFQATWGIRKRCPLSPFLYILIVDSLSRKLQMEMLAGNLLGIRTAHGFEPTNHTLFIDDSLFLGWASKNITREFKRVLHSYCTISGGKINYNKS